MSLTTRQAIDATLARLNSLDVVMRGIEVDADEDLAKRPMGRTTFTSALEVPPTYVTVAKNTDGLSENLQRKLHECVTEIFLIVTRAAESEFDVEKITKVLDELHTKIDSVMPWEIDSAVHNLRQCSQTYTMINKKSDYSTSEDSLNFHAAVSLISAVVIEDALVTIDLDDDITL